MAINILSRMDEIIEDMTGDWKGLFRSREFHEYLRKYTEVLMAGTFEGLRVEGVRIPRGVEENLLKRIDIQLIFDPNSEIETAATTMTDRKFVILINGAGVLVNKVQTVAEKFEVVMGLLVHEVCHRIYTDFPTGNGAVMAMLTQGRFFPIPPRNINTQEGMMFRSRLAQNPEYRELFAKVLKEIQNSTEDGYIEAENRLHYPGQPSFYIDVVNDVMYDDVLSLTDIYNRSEEICNLEAILNQWLIYAVYGELKLGELKTDILDPQAERILYDGLEVIDDILVERDPRIRSQKALEMMVMLVPVIDEEIRKQEQDQQGQGQSNPQNKGQQSNGGTGNNGQQSSDPSQNSQDQNGGNTQNTKNPPGGSEEAIQAVQNMIDRIVSEATGSAKMPDHDDCQTQALSNPNAPQNANMDLDALRNQSGGAGRGATGEHNSETSQRTLEDIVRDLAEKQVLEEVERDRAEEMQREAEELTGQESVKVFRSSSVEDSRKEIYDELYSNVSAVSKKLVRLTKKRFKEESEEDAVTRLASGNRFNVKSYIRDPYKGFERKVYDETKVNLEVFLLIDESGSMSGSNEAAAMQTAILMEDFCRQIPVPLTVYGFTTGETYCDLYSYVEPVKIDRNDRYRLTGISARGGTPTVAAMKFAVGRLSKSDPKTNKILFVITDGDAGDDDGKGTRTREVLEQARKNRIQVIACGIGYSRGSIVDQFGEEVFLPIDVLDEMPERLLQIVQRGLFATRR